MVYVSPTKLKNMSIAYDSLQNANEYKLANMVQNTMKKYGYEVKVSRDKYVFMYSKQKK
jgi:ABC-type proline/glycine betaine transport system substrate-binding protein